MNRVKLTELARRRPHDTMPENRENDPAGTGQAAGVEQFAAGWAAQSRDPSPRHEGAPRHEVYPDQVVPRARRRLIENPPTMRSGGRWPGPRPPAARSR